MDLSRLNRGTWGPWHNKQHMLLSLVMLSLIIVMLLPAIHLLSFLYIKSYRGLSRNIQPCNMENRDIY